MSKRKAMPRRFIGGHYDGALMVCENDYVVLPEKYEPCAAFIQPGEVYRNPETEFHCYSKQKICGNKTLFEVMTPPGMSGDEIMGRLISGYNP